MRPSNFFKTVLPIGLALLAPALHAAPQGKPNVILIMTDDQGYGDIAAHGNPIVRTPNMDRLHKEGVRLTDFHVNAFCAPTRAALMTGRMADRTGVTSTYTQRSNLPHEEVIMPEFFKASGYRTGQFGKWHLGDNFPHRPMDRGFEEWFGLGSGGLSTTSDFWNNDRLDDTYWHNGKPEKKDGFCTDVYFDEAMKFIDASTAEEKPFFCYLATNVPHWDWNIRPEWLKPYAKLNRQQGCFYASVERADYNIGRLLEYLDKEKLADNTIIIFLTDNGSDVPDQKTAYMGGMRGKKGSLYDGGHRVPCFIRGPKSLIGEPRDISGLTSHTDLLPTFIDLLQLKNPERKLLPRDGRSLRPLLTGDTKWDDRTFIMHMQNGYKEPIKGKSSLIMTEDWRMVDGKELYEIKKDPMQKANVAAQHPDVLKKLQAEYERLWTDCGLPQRQRERPILTDRGLGLNSLNAKNATFTQQNAVRTAQVSSGTWLIKVEKAGNYRIEARRWPREADTAMTAAVPPASNPELIYSGPRYASNAVPGKALPVHHVRCRATQGENDKLQIKDVAPGDKAVIFEAALPAGEVELNVNLMNAKKQRLSGAYYVYIEEMK